MKSILEVGRKNAKESKTYITYIKRCKYCGCLFLYQDEDLKLSYDGIDFLIDCPQCKEYNNIIFKKKYKLKKERKRNEKITKES